MLFRSRASFVICEGRPQVTGITILHQFLNVIISLHEFVLLAGMQIFCNNNIHLEEIGELERQFLPQNRPFDGNSGAI